MEVYAVVRIAGYTQETYGLYTTEVKAERICALLKELETETGYYVVAMKVEEDIEEELREIQEWIDEFAE